jgi:hypothetical protein
MFFIAVLAATVGGRSKGGKLVEVAFFKRP